MTTRMHELLYDVMDIGRLSKTQLSQLIGVTNRQFDRIHAGAVPVRSDQVDAIAEFLGINALLLSIVSELDDTNLARLSDTASCDEDAYGNDDLTRSILMAFAERHGFVVGTALEGDNYFRRDVLRRLCASRLQKNRLVPFRSRAV